MNDEQPDGLYRPRRPVRFVTAASLFDGHDAAINIMRRLLQAQGAEVIHLGHNRSVDEVVEAAVAEDVQGVAVSSYQGGHLEYFKYLVDRLAEEGRSDIKVYGGGGGVIIPSEIAELESYGVTRVFSPADGQRLGLPQMINILVQECDVDPAAAAPVRSDDVVLGETRSLARAITAIESHTLDPTVAEALSDAARHRPAPVLGITGTGGSGKSSVTDELVLRLRMDQGDKIRIAVLAVDPSKRRGGGALLGDRIRMNAIHSAQVYFRSLATRESASEIPDSLHGAIDACRAAGYDLIMVETPGIGQGDAAVVDVADLSLYVMTPEFGAPSQLEKIDMLDLADVVAINKFDRQGSEDALRSVERQWRRVRGGTSADSVRAPIFGTVASRFNDEGTTALYQYLRDELSERGLPVGEPILNPATTSVSPSGSAIVPAERVRYLADITATIRSYHAATARRAELVRQAQQVEATRTLMDEAGEAQGGATGGTSGGAARLGAGGVQGETMPVALSRLAADTARQVDPRDRALLDEFARLREERTGLGERRGGDGSERSAGPDGQPAPLWRVSPSGSRIPRVALPRMSDEGDLLRWLRSEHLPGHFPFTAGVFPLKRDTEDPARMFAGEGDPQRTNRRFHLLAEGQPATRLSTAFDSVTLYGRDPDTRPDVYGKIGTSGVSTATLDDMKTLFDGLDLCDPTTSVSMTINGPAPTILAMFLNTAIDQQVDRFRSENGRTPTDAESADLRAWTLRTVRGTVQADILKEDQGQNTCIFSTEFSLGVMADIQEFFVQNEMANFYSVSISGYHIAEAGANPITQLAFTLANGFTYVEAYLARGMSIDDFAPNLSFFFSNGMDVEYTVIGRVARRIWAIAMRDRYGASERSQKLKYHIQTSGRSLHAQEMSFNDIRTTLQALCAIYDNANSLHTNAFDEAVTTPTADSVRRAMAIQLVINREWGLAMNENPLQGSFIVEELTDLVEEAVLDELERISTRGGVLGAMETGYQRGRIQAVSMLYETRKHDGSLPIVGVNTFTRPGAVELDAPKELARATEEEKRSQLQRLRDFQGRHAAERPAALAELRETALAGGNVFSTLMETVRHASLGEITETLFEVGGSYRRNI
ncbi:MAG: methylmalonyl-CoA mutase family protein [Acidimicrobiales bacterium]